VGLETKLTNLIQNLDSSEINILMKLYYNRETSAKDFIESNFEDEVLQNLIDKNLILADSVRGESMISLTDEGLNVCGSVMFNKVESRYKDYKTEIKTITERTVACLVNRVMWRNVISKENGFIDDITKPYTYDESMWYERVLLKDKRMADTLEKFYNILEKFDLIQNTNGQRWCSPEVENFLRDKYRNIMDLTWTEEESLKYYYFFFTYAQDQKNLLDFTRDDEELRSMFFGEKSKMSEYWFSSNHSTPQTVISALGISENRVMGFIDEMKKNDIVKERNYPISSSMFDDQNERIFVIKDIKGFMGFITNKFLTPVVDSVLKQ